MVKECVIFLCLLSITFAAVIQSPQPIESNAAAVAEQIAPEDKKSNDESSDLETAEFKHFGRIFGHGAVAAPIYVQQSYVQPVHVQPVHIQPVQYQPVHVQPVHVQPVVQYQHVHTPDCGCNGGGYQHGGQSYGYNYNYHYNNY